MDGARSGSSSHLVDVSGHLGITLRALEVDTALSSVLFVARLLPLWKPSLGVRHRAWVLWVETLWHAGLSFPLDRNIDLGAAVHIL